MNTKHLLPLLLAAGLLPVHPLAADEYADTTRVKEGEPAPTFTCRTLDGEPFSLQDQKGKVVLINFFATWCGPCLAELPQLEREIYQQYKDRKDFKVIVIGREHDTEELGAFVKKKAFNFPMAPDPKREIYGKYADKFIPRNFLIGKDGTIKLSAVGYSEQDFKKVLQSIENELGL